MGNLRLALRQLGRSPGFTAVALLTLTLGMGATSAFFSLLYSVVLQQPSYPDAERLVSLHNVRAGAPDNGGRLSRAEFRDYRERQRAFDGLAAVDLGRMTLTASTGDAAFAERVKVSRVTESLFPLLGVQPVLGRAFQPGDERGNPSVVISHDLWRTQFASSDDILNRTVRLNGIERAIIGVMPAGFAYPEPDMGAWLPLDLAPRDDSDRTDHYLGVIGRRASGVTADAARLDLQRLARDLQRDMGGAYPTDANWSIGAQSLRDSLFGRMYLPLALLMAAASSVLLIACVNVAIMSLLRALARHREMSIRVAVGASRGALVRQLITEAAVLSALGAAGALMLANWAIEVLKAFAPGDIPRLQDAAIDLPTTLFTGAVLVAVTLVVGLAPALVALRRNAFDRLMSAGRSSDGRRATRLRDALTVIEIGLAAALVLCGGLTLRSLDALLKVDLGFATTQRFAFKTNLTERDYPDAARVDGFYRQLTSGLESLPGVQSLGAISYLPLSGEGQSVAAVPAVTPAGRNASPAEAGWGIVRGAYFETMGVALLRGRLFSAEDRADSLPVTVIDEVLATTFWPSASAAIGQQLRLGSGPQAETRTIIGVVRHVGHLGPGRESLPSAYAPQSQVYQCGMYTVIRTTGNLAALSSAIRAALVSTDPSVPMYFAESIDQRYADAVALPRFTAGLVGAFSVVALALAGVGIFGVTAYASARRTREFGIRFALGAQRLHVGALVLGRVGLLAGLGLLLGAVLGLFMASQMTGLLFGVKVTDVPTMLAVMAVIAATALLASLAPLRRAVRVSAAETLRAD
ncbi:MAG TPA: ABC transporter permease [Luteitalea sp.]|nr:ABC transporter permease [Luteitalea sp.]